MDSALNIFSGLIGFIGLVGILKMIESGDVNIPAALCIGIVTVVIIILVRVLVVQWVT